MDRCGYGRLQLRLEGHHLGPGRVQLGVRQAEHALVQALRVEPLVVQPEALAFGEVERNHVEAVVAAHGQARPQAAHVRVALQPLRDQMTP